MKPKNKPKISVVMSTCNEPLKWIAESIKSILNQTFNNFEFIVINDNPKRKELQEFLEKYKKQDKRIILIKNKENLGLTKSLNKGLRKANGEYIARMDADDISLLKRFEIQYKYLEKHNDIFLIGAGAININKNGEKTTSHKPFTDEKKLKQVLEKRNSIYHPTIFFRNEKDNFYREKFRYAQDYDFYLCLLSKNKRLTNISNTLIKYRINSNSISFSKRAKQNLFSKRANKFYHQRLKNKKDEYNEFDPNKILNLNIGKSKNKNVLESEIKANFKINNFKKTRKFCKKYFEYHGYFNKIPIYYFASFLGKTKINILRKIIFN